MGAGLLAVFALAGCTAPEAAPTPSDAGARAEARDRVATLVASLAPQEDSFGFAREATAAAAEGVELIGVESSPAEPGDAFGSLSFRVAVDASSFPDVTDLPAAYCFLVPFAGSGPAAGAEDGGVEQIDCPADATVITPPPAQE